MRAFITIVLLLISNSFMTYAWYGHLRDNPDAKKTGIWVYATTILISWAIAFFEYIFMVPANKIGYQGNGGPFSLIQLKIIQEVASIVIFMVFSLIFFKEETLKWNHAVAFLLILGAVYLVFKK
ncbi:hypothetical protein D3C87_408900 [compost metagenome]